MGEHLKRLAEHIPAAPSQQQVDLTFQVLDRLNTELHVHLDALETGQAVSSKAAAAG